MPLLKSAIRNPQSAIGTSAIRSGFTLIEILLVLGIMLVLMAIGIGAAMKGYQWVLRNNTEVVMRKVQERMQRRYDQIVAEARNWDNNTDLMRLAGGNPKRAEALKIKLLYKWNFPLNYEEAVRNLEESGFNPAAPPGRRGYNYLPTGYPIAQAIVQRLTSRTGGGGTTLLNRAPIIAMLQSQLGVSAAEAQAIDLRNQNSACLAVVFELTLGTSVDELAPSEIGRYPQVAAGGPGVAYDYNPLIIDAWGTPLFYMRYGNLITNLPNYAWLTTALGPAGQVPAPPVGFAPVSATYGGVPYPFDYAFFGNYYAPIVERAKTAFPLKYQRQSYASLDVDDPESTLTLGWRTQLNPYWQFANSFPLPPYASNANGLNSGFAQSFGYVMTTFGPSAASNLDFPRMYAPLVVLSAGGDRRFSSYDPARPGSTFNDGWDDNLDSYRLTTRVGNQQ